MEKILRQLDDQKVQINQLKQSIEDYEDFIETNKEITK